MSETIKVVIRFKGREELEQQEARDWTLSPDGKQLQAPNLEGSKAQPGDLKFTFDHILDSDCDQENMYRMAGSETVQQFCSGFNGTIFAYGMSGTGKTFSMLGPEEVVEVIKRGGDIPEGIQSLYGIIPRAIRDVFTFMNKAIEQEQCQFELLINYFEIYKESLNDLLQTDKKLAENLKIVLNNGKCVIYNSKAVPVSSPEEIFYHI